MMVRISAIALGLLTAVLMLLLGVVIPVSCDT